MRFFFNPKAQVIVFCPSNEDLVNLVAEMSEYYDDSDLLMKKILNTVTHEICHEVLFLQSSGGLSAVNIDVLYDNGDIYRTIGVRIHDLKRGFFPESADAVELANPQKPFFISFPLTAADSSAGIRHLSSTTERGSY